jgi:hypothetical protein
MSVNQIIQLAKQLPAMEQLAIAEALLQSVIAQQKMYPDPVIDDQQTSMSIAAEALLNDYTNDEELTIFTQIDGDPVYEKR